MLQTVRHSDVCLIPSVFMSFEWLVATGHFNFYTIQYT